MEKEATTTAEQGHLTSNRHAVSYCTSMNRAESCAVQCQMESVTLRMYLYNICFTINCPSDNAVQHELRLFESCHTLTRT